MVEHYFLRCFFQKLNVPEFYQFKKLVFGNLNTYVPKNETEDLVQFFTNNTHEIMERKKAKYQKMLDCKLGKSGDNSHSTQHKTWNKAS